MSRIPDCPCWKKCKILLGWIGGDEHGEPHYGTTHRNYDGEDWNPKHNYCFKCGKVSKEE